MYPSYQEVIGRGDSKGKECGLTRKALDGEEPLKVSEQGGRPYQMGDPRRINWKTWKLETDGFSS